MGKSVTGDAVGKLLTTEGDDDGTPVRGEDVGLAEPSEGDFEGSTDGFLVGLVEGEEEGASVIGRSVIGDMVGRAVPCVGVVEG